ncbi:MAG: hypothetical protein ACRESI_06515 [Gammaproteobacteria bacterium]
MSNLFVANCTKQKHGFIYRMPEKSGSSAPIEIPPGEQREVAKNLTSTDLEYILAHQSIYGMVSEREVDHMKRFVGLCYSVDSPVKASTLLHAFKNNDVVMIETARENRKRTAAAIASELDSNMRDANSPSHVGRVTVEVSEVTKPGHDQTLNEGIEVTKEGKAPRHSSRSRT